jgi:phytol kinase
LPAGGREQGPDNTIKFFMASSAKNILDFFAANFPGAEAMALGGPAGLLWAAVCLMLAGFLKTRKHWATGYTRKLFHFLIFGSVVVVHAIWKTQGVCLFGAMTTAVIAYALFRGPGHLMYEAMAREKDRPRRTHYIVVAYFSTLIGGLLSNIFFPDAAVFGYLVCGLGDAIAEPVGTRFGKHRYRALAVGGVRAVRSLEGSGSVFLVSMLALILFMAFSPHFELTARSAIAAILIAGASTAAEAVSPHGWDNTTLQVVPAWLGAVLL